MLNHNEAGRQQAAATFSTLSLNTNRRADLAGLPGLLRDCSPDLVFLQEVVVSTTSLATAVSGLGYTVWRSAIAQPRRCIAVLSKHAAVVTDPVPGYLQQVTVHGLTFLHLHCPAGTSAELRAERNRLFQEVRRIISPLAISPILVGDFNCVINPFDVQVGPVPFDPHKMSVSLRDLITDFAYVDVFRQLFPDSLQFSFFRPNMLSSRLDRLYVPPVFATSCFIARYIPTLSDHSSLYCVFSQAGLGLRLQPRPRKPPFYWKFNSALLSEPTFTPLFADFWAALLPSRDNFHGGPAAWWEQAAKPAVRAFCQAFSRQVAARNKHTRRFFTRALELALQDNDWLAIAACKARLQGFDQQLAAGLALRGHVPLIPGEEPSIFLLAQEGKHGHSPGLEAVKNSNGDILREPEAVEAEILSYFEALFQGRHITTPDRPEPHDSGTTFSPSRPEAAANFLAGLPTLTPDQSAALDRPFELHELRAAVASAASGKSPGLDGLSYEFYNSTLPLTGPPLLAALNSMLEAGQLSESLRQGVVRLLPKVAGVPTAAQLRPITLLCTDYKLLTKMFVGRLLPLLPHLLTSTQLCSIRGRSIFDGGLAIWSSLLRLNHLQSPGYLVSLDFFHAYDRVDLHWVEAILEAMGVGAIFRGWIRTLHSDASARFMCHKLSLPLQILFSIRQGDPLAMLLFLFHIEPLLHRLQRDLTGLRVGLAQEAGLGYVDDVAVLSCDEQDLLRMDSAVADFEAVSGALLNRNRKSVIVGLGSWEARSVKICRFFTHSNSKI
jgi:exonuclease III